MSCSHVAVVFGAAREVERLPPLPRLERVDALRAGEQRRHVLRRMTREQRPHLGEQLRSAPSRARAARRVKATLDRECARDARRLTRAQREQQVAGLEVGAADHVHHREPARHRPAQIDARQLGGRDGAFLALAEAQATRAQQPAAQHERGERTLRRRRQLHVQRAEHGRDQLDAAIDVTADEQLFGSEAAAIERDLGGSGRIGRGEICIGGFGAAAVEPECFGELGIQLAAIGMTELEREAVIASTAIEREHRNSFVGSGSGMACREVRTSCFAPVECEHRLLAATR
jgi:hypothetical protein